MFRTFILVVLCLSSVGVTSAQNLPANPCSPSPEPPNIRTGAEIHLACEWRNANAIENMLNAMKGYTQGENSWGDAVEEVFRSADHTAMGFYCPALGVRNEKGEPRTQALGAFLLMVATANLLTKDDMKKTDGDRKAEHEQILSDAETIVKFLYTHDERETLVVANDLFQRKGLYYEGLYELLKALHKSAPDNIGGLETLRAAYQIGRNKLTETVAKKINSEN